MINLLFNCMISSCPEHSEGRGVQLGHEPTRPDSRRILLRLHIHPDSGGLHCGPLGGQVAPGARYPLHLPADAADTISGTLAHPGFSGGARARGIWGGM